LLQERSVRRQRRTASILRILCRAVNPSQTFCSQLDSRRGAPDQACPLLDGTACQAAQRHEQLGLLRGELVTGRPGSVVYAAPEVTVAPPAPPPPSTAAVPASSPVSNEELACKLRYLRELRDLNVLTQDEYRAKVDWLIGTVK
jgi:hypothetical protein